jgi:segregation and condensation protein B
MDLSASIEAILFWKGEPVAIKKLASLLEKSEAEVGEHLAELEKKLEHRGLQLIYKENDVMLGTRAELSNLIEKLTKEELVKDLGKAGLETLSIILYRGPIARRDIDYIRGVNSNFILRNLMIRGLVERIQHPTDQRSFQYKPTFELLSWLGVSRLEDLPEFTDIRNEIESRKEQSENAEI